MIRSILLSSMLSSTKAFIPSTSFHLKSFAVKQSAFERPQRVLSENANDIIGINRIMPILNSSSDDNSSNEKNSIDVMMGKVDIPEEYREEIFRAEANTPAAKDRDTRVAIFGIIALLGIAVSSFNAFLSNMRDGADLTPINDLGFGWVSGNPLTSFLFLNKIGGAIALLSAGLGGTMVELEQRTKNENAEKIWAELQRRKTQAEGGKKVKKKKNRGIAPSSNKKMSKKNRKRLDALSEVVFEEEEESVVNSAEVGGSQQQQEGEKASEIEGKKDEEGGIFGKVKDFYNKADAMAQSQALLLNKELEDRGVVEKITDETGLKVIGKDAAAKLQSRKDDKN